MAMRTGTLGPPRDLAVKYVRVDSLTPCARNVRRHSLKQIRKIARSLVEFGWTNPLIVTRGGEIVCGHGRLEAAKLLDATEVPVIVIDDLSDTQRRAYILADNEIAAKASWDRGMLATELQGLIDLGFDVELTGFDTIEIDTLLTVGNDDAVPEEEIVELPDEKAETLTTLGDHWVIGRHHLLCADATVPESYELLLGDARPELAFLDPPPAGVVTVAELVRRTVPLSVATVKEAGGRPADRWSILVALAAEHGTLPRDEIGPETFFHRKSLEQATGR